MRLLLLFVAGVALMLALGYLVSDAVPKDVQLLALGLLMAAAMGWELRFAYRTGSVHRAEGGLIYRAAQPGAYWRNVYLGWVLLVASLGAALLGAGSLVAG